MVELVLQLVWGRHLKPKWGPVQHDMPRWFDNNFRLWCHMPHRMPRWTHVHRAMPRPMRRWNVYQPVPRTGGSGANWQSSANWESGANWGSSANWESRLGEYGEIIELLQ